MTEAILEWGPVVGLALLVILGIVVVIQVRELMRTQRRLLRRLEKLGPVSGRLRREIRRVATALDRLAVEAAAERARARERASSGTPDGDTAGVETSDARVQPNDGEEGESPPPEFSRGTAEEIYQQWKKSESPKPEIPGWEISWMRASGKTSGDELNPGRQLLRDSEGRGDFVRFSPAGGQQGILFPHPHRALDTDVYRGVFPPRSRADHDEPDPGAVAISRQKDGQWLIK